MMTPYASEAEALATYIARLIPDHPEILAMTNPFDLFKVEGFAVPDGLEPSASQVGWALRRAKELAATVASAP